MKTRILILIGLLLLLFVTVNLFGKDLLFKNISKTDIPDNTPTEGTFCTLDAKMCPDGSYVGRVGPKCEFAECPTVETDSVEVHLAAKGVLKGYSITPLEVIEDSRCPSDVVCIQAGTVRLRTSIVSSTETIEKIFTLNQSVTIGDQNIELIDVKPHTVSTKPINKADYIFVFKILDYVPEQM